MAKRERAGRAPGRRRRLVAVVAAGLMLAGAGVALPEAPASAAAPFDSEYLYGSGQAEAGQPVSRAVYQIDPATGATTQVLTAPESASSYNSLALTADGNAMLMTNNTTVFMYDAPSETWFQAPRPSNDAASNFMGGVNSLTGYFYYGGNRWAGAPSDTFVFAAYDLANNTVIPNALTVTAAGNTGWNGDLVFDQRGNMFILASDATGANPDGSVVYQVDASDVSTQTGGTAIATAVGPKIMGTQYANGTAYGPDGYGYISRNDNNQSGPSTLLRTDPVSFSLVGTVALDPAVRLVDLASRAFQPTALVNVDLPNGRHADTDQFHLSYQGPGPDDPLLEAETTGTEPGLQDQEPNEYIGRTATFPGDTYRIEQSAAGTTNLGNYRTSWACIVLGTGETVASGTGSTGSFDVPESPTVDIDCTFTNIPIRPALTLEKSADRTELVAGQTITYSFRVENTGDVALDIVINEGAFTGSGELSDVVCPVTNLAPRAGTSCTATYEVTQADVDRGSVVNSATATGRPPNGGDPVTTQPDEARVPSTPAPGISLVKSASPERGGAEGDEITYTFTVRNTGNATLTDVTVTEGDFSGTGQLGDIVCPPAAASLAPGLTVNCTASYTLTQADVDAGGVTNSATATGTPPGGATPPVSPPARAELPIPAAPALSIEKSADRTELVVGETITYTFVVRNTGNVSLSDVTVDEGEFTGSGTMSEIVCDPVRTEDDDGDVGSLFVALAAAADLLAPGQQVTCRATYTVTQEDVDRGSVRNSATASGTPPRGGAPVTSEPDDASVPQDPEPGISIVKSADRTELIAGETITYTFVVTNTGNVTLSEVSVDEGEFTGTGTMSEIVCEPSDGGSALVAPLAVVAGSLAPDRQLVCTATYVVTQADVDRGSLVNSATASGTPPGGDDPVTSEPSEVRLPQDPVPGIALVKSASPEQGGAAGEEIVYTFRVTNTGNVSLSEIAVDEGEFTGTGELGPVVCPAEPASIAPGQFVDCTASYTLTQADVDAGGVTNSATATGTPPGDADAPVSPPSEVRLPIAAAPAISIVKTADAERASSVGQRITYSFTVTNTGNVTLTEVAVVEGAFSGAGELSAISCPSEPLTLAAGEQAVCTAEYEVQADDLREPALTNTATATGTPPGGDAVTSEASEASVPSAVPATPAPSPGPTPGEPEPAGPGALSRTGIELGAGILLVIVLLLSVGAGTIVVARRKRIDG
ncbi:hypothetical protein ROT00_08685 [Agromyces mediolanus]|uniref:DUF7507 domain-containing protein n=1 Tax=Agromyces mediolanus TaxID=41986 RepID=UPI00383528F8